MNRQHCKFIYLFICLFVLAVLAPVALCLLGRSSIIWAMSPALLALVIFITKRISLFVQASLDTDPPIYASYVVEMTDMHHHAQLLLGMGVFLSFCLEWPQTMILLRSSSQVARIYRCEPPCLVMYCFNML
jgi:hypothetical protein